MLSCFHSGPDVPKDANPLIVKASKEKWSLWTLEKGLNTLVDALENKLQDSGITVLKETHLASIKINENKTIEAKGAEKDEVFVADHLVSSIPSTQLAGLLPEEHALLKNLLHKINAVTVAVVNLEFEGSVLDLEGFGYLYPSQESRKVLGVIFDSSTFSHGDRRSSKSTRLTV